MNAEAEKLLDFEIAKAEAIKRRRFNPYRSVMGKTPTAIEMASWGNDRWMDFLRFNALFIEIDPAKDLESFKFTDQKRKNLDDYLSIPNHPFHEFIYRVDRWPGEDTNSEYRFKFLAISRVVLTYLKRHPSIIGSDMKILIQSYPKRMGWVLGQYKVEQTRIGDVLSRDESTDTASIVPMPSIQAKMMNSLILMADMYERIAGSISDKDVKALKLTEKLKALKDLSFIFTTASKKQQANHFSQININTKDARGAEEMMLDFIRKGQEK